jgi:YfiH family protein
MVGDDPAHVATNRARIAEALGGTAEQIYSTRQVHGADWLVVNGEQPPGALARAEADILLSGARGVLLLLKFADCTPLLLWDPGRRWVALAHAGWRGTGQNVAGAAVRALGRTAGTEPAELWAGIGPAIGVCCYEVSEEVVGAVMAATPGGAPISRPGRRGRPHLDLVEASRQQLIAAGLRPDHILAAERCTACASDTFYSHRALGMPAGRFAVAAGLR